MTFPVAGRSYGPCCWKVLRSMLLGGLTLPVAGRSYVPCRWNVLRSLSPEGLTFPVAEMSYKVVLSLLFRFQNKFLFLTHTFRTEDIFPFFVLAIIRSVCDGGVSPGEGTRLWDVAAEES